MTKDEAFLEWYNNAHWGNEDLKECCHRSWNAAIKQARSAPVQEPVAFNAGVPPLYPEMKDGETISVEYTTPPAAQRQWVGLTDEEFEDIELGCRSTTFGKIEAMQKVEAKLRSKNNG